MTIKFDTGSFFFVVHSQPDQCSNFIRALDDSRRINAMLDEVESWRSRLTLASFQELVEDLMRRCIRAPKDVAVALTNSKG